MENTTKAATPATNSLGLGRKIRVVRRLKGYSQEYMAIQLGISQNAYSKLERGKIKLHPQRILKISSVLNIEAYNIFRIRESDFQFSNHLSLPNAIETLSS